MTDIRVSGGDVDLCPVEGFGPEDILQLADGSHLVGLEGGDILVIGKDFTSQRRLCNTGGRVLGMEHLQDGGVVVCDSRRGLLRLDPVTGVLEVLVDRIDGVPLGLCNNPAVARDGTIYFSASSTRHPLEGATLDVVEKIASGRLFRRLPDGRVEQLMDGLFFANGVVLSPGEDCVLVAETGAARISRFWLSGARAGARDIFVEGLPGLPDNMNVGSDGLIWVAMVMSLTRDLAKLWAAPYWLRWLLARAPAFIKGRPDRVVLVAAYDFDGVLHRSLRLENGPFHFATSAREVAGLLYLTSIEEGAVARIRLPT